MYLLSLWWRIIRCELDFEDWNLLKFNLISQFLSQREQAAS